MKKTVVVLLALFAVISLIACGAKRETNEGETDKAGITTWYLGKNDILAGEIDVEAIFEGIEDTINPSEIYASVEYTEKMLRGSYTLNNLEKDLDKVRKEIPFQEFKSNGNKRSLTILPIAVHLGAEHMCNTKTAYHYGEYSNVTEDELAVIQFATEDKISSVPCIYEVDGNTITFRQITKTSAEEAPLVYEETDVEFQFEFELSGPYITFKKDNTSIQLKAFCLTENTDTALSLSGYSLQDSPLIDELDFFSSSEFWNYAVKRDGSYYDLSAFKMTDDGKFTVYLKDRNPDGESVEFIEQYAYILQSETSDFVNSFSIVLLDENMTYYYVDDISQREARILREQGTDVSSLTEEEIEEIAEKKADLFDDLYEEFKAQGINVAINRGTGEITMDSAVLFGGDSAVITEEGKELLNKFLLAYTTIINNENYAGFIAKTMVEGHIAPIMGSTYESGLALSEERANNVKDYCLSEDTGVDVSKLATTLEAIGYSNAKPIYGADGNADLEASRRVSFRFIVNIQNLKENTNE